MVRPVKRSRPPKLGRLLLAGLLAVAAGGGCHRAQYRQRADNEAYMLLDQKTAHAGDQAPSRIRIEPSGASRLFDPFDRDRPPMPEDDPRSHRYMHKVDNKRGYPLWHANGDTNTAENPAWISCLPLNECGVLVLDADTAVRLALLHSPDYQQQLETLYLSALDVSSERFRFDTQFFGGLGTTGQVGPYTAGGESSSTVGVNGDLVARRTFATGADLVVGIANSITWQVSGPDNTQSVNGLLNFAFTQPLLRGAGRDVVLERLTRSERQLLSNVRSFERYRQSFYLNVTIGRAIENNVRRSGGLTGVGLAGFNGLGSGFAGLTNNAAGGQNAQAQAANNAQVGGFLGLVQDRLQIQNQTENVIRLRENVLLLEDTLIELLTTIPADAEVIPRQRLQVAQARQQLVTSQTQLLNQQTQHQAAVDALLRTLGLPPYICVDIQDPLLTRFQLIRKELRDRRIQIGDSREEVAEINAKILENATNEINPTTNLPERRLAWNNELQQQLNELRAALRPVAELQQQLVNEELPIVRQDLDQLREIAPKRMQRLNQLRTMYEREREQICALLPIGGIDPTVFEVGALDGLPAELDAEYEKQSKLIEEFGQRIHETAAGLDRLIAEYQQNPIGNGGQGAKLFDRVRDEAILATQNLLTSLTDQVLVLQLLQARARAESILLPEVDMDPRTAVEIARRNRHDWFNARAALVDAWRLIEFNADSLESVLDFTFSGDLIAPPGGDNPLDFRRRNSRLNVGLQWDAPLTRLQERNTYRQSLIEFQQARRQFYRYEDGVWQTLRAELRQAQANQVNFELQRLAVRIAAEQISLNDDIRQLQEARGLSSGPTAARDIINALNDLLTAQNGLLNIWMNYELTRRGLDFDLGTMQLTPEGLWIDPIAIRPDTVGDAAAMNAVMPLGADCMPGDGMIETTSRPVDIIE